MKKDVIDQHPVVQFVGAETHNVQPTHDKHNCGLEKSSSQKYCVDILLFPQK